MIPVLSSLTLGALLLLGVLSDVDDIGEMVPEDTDPDRTLSLIDSLKNKMWFNSKYVIDKDYK